MLKIENVEVMGWEHAIRDLRLIMSYGSDPMTTRF